MTQNLYAAASTVRSSAPATVPELVAATAARTPSAVALTRAGEACTYEQLAERMTATARGILATGVAPGDVVAVWGTRDIGTVVAMLGVLRSGAVLTMLDATQSESRMRSLLQRAQPQLVIDASGAHAGEPDTHGLTDLERSGGRPAEPTDLPDLADLAELADLESGDDPFATPHPGRTPAYLCFTSGTTGEPRGVLGGHGALAQFCAWEQHALGIGPGDRVAQTAAPTFDAVFKDIFPALIGGATVCLPPTDRPFTDLAQVMQWLADEQITVLQTVPSVLAALLDTAAPGLALPALRLICQSGEPLRGSLVTRWRSTVAGDARFVNLYGTTEATILKSWYEVPAGPISAGVLPVGKATDGAELLLVNRRGRRCGVGEPGEVLIRTPYLTLGAWPLGPDQESLFEVNPLNPDDPGDLVQRTGDIGRFNALGDLEIHGRVDDQIKVNGVRVHPAEVAALIAQLPTVKDAAVVAVDAQLNAYVVAEPDAGLSPATIRRHVAEHGSNSMVPAGVVLLDRLPLNHHGKLDRAALPAPAADSGAEREPEDETAWTETERRLAQLWGEAFHREITSRQADFFDLGGHSLMLARMLARIRSTFGVDLNLQAMFNAPTIAALAAAVDGARAEAPAGAVAEPGVVPVEHGAAQPLTPEQEGLWLLQQLDPGSAAYNMAGLFRLPASVAPHRVRKAFLAVCERHEALRLRFRQTDRRTISTSPICRPPPVSRPPAVAAADLDFADLPPAASQQAAIAALQAAAAEPFDLAAGPPVRVRTIAAPVGELLVGLTIHHLCCDGISWSLLTTEADGVLTEGALDPTAPALQYGDYVAWRADRDDPARTETHLAYWRDLLAGAASVDLPRGRPRPGSRPHELRTRRLNAGPELTAAVDQLCRASGATQYMAMMAALAVVLARACGQSDITIGSDSAGRDRAELEDVVGFFVRTHAYRFDLSGDPALDEALRRVRETLVTAADHLDVPYTRVVQAASADLDGDRRTLFSVMLRMPPLQEVSHQHRVLLPLDVLDEAADGTAAAPTAKFDLTVVVRPGAAGTVLDLEYDADALQDAFVDALGERMLAVLRFGTAEPGTPLSRITRDGHPFAEAIAAQPWPAASGAVERWAAETPDAVAISWSGGDLSYRQLAEAVVAASADLTPGSTVGILGGKTPATVAYLVAALRRGAVPVLLDEALPAARRDQMVDGAGVRQVVQTGDLPTGADAPAITADPHDPAYVFFTSSTTGQAKAVVGTHSGLDHFVAWESAEFAIGSEDRVAQLTTLSFDAVLRDVFVPLSNGATLCLPPAAALEDTRRMLEWLAAERVTVVHTTPSVAAAWLREADPDPVRLTNLRLLCLAGESLAGSLVADLRARLLAPDAEVVNFYGPTETTMIKTFHRAPVPAPEGPVPIGRALPGAQLVVVGEGDYVCGPGERGEIVLRTPYRTLGYLGDAERTASVFRPNPLGSDALYYTGDLATIDASGEVIVEGRRDDLTKIRGVRVHPAEVAAQLATHPEVRQVHVLADRNGKDVQLVGYVVRTPGSTLTTEALRDYARQRLPLAMVPSLLLFLDRLTLLPNGKLDRSSLSGLPAVQSAARIEPRDEAEAVVWRLWADLLGHEDFGVTDDFFAIGGHSLLATILITRLRKQLGMALSLQNLLQGPRVDLIAARIRDDATAPAPSPGGASETLVTLRAGRAGGPVLFVVHPIGGDVLCYRDLAAALSPELTVIGIRSQQPNGRQPSVRDLAEAYVQEVLRVQPDGPYRLAGWSMGGVVAYEMARQLAFEGRRPDAVVMLDSYAPGSGAYDHFADPATDRATAFTRDLERTTGSGSAAEDLGDLWSSRFAIFDANATALAGHRIRRAHLPDTRIALVLAGAQQRPAAASPTLGWREALGTGVDVRTVPGADHFALLRQPSVGAAAAIIDEVLAAQQIPQPDSGR